MLYCSPWQRKFRIIGLLLGILFHVVAITLVTNVPGLHKGGFGFLFYWYMPAILLGLPWSLCALFFPSEIVSLLGIAGSVCLNCYLIGWIIDAMVNNLPVTSSKLQLSTEQVRKALSSDPATLTSEEVEALTEFIDNAGGITNARATVGV
ncbi:MAG: hypothetical protein ACR2NM_04415 [Bythopirellula sp.]